MTISGSLLWGCLTQRKRPRCRMLAHLVAPGWTTNGGRSHRSSSRQPATFTWESSCMIQGHIEAQIKWLPFCRHFQILFSCMKIVVHIFEFKFFWHLCLSVQLTVSQHWFRLWLGTKQVTSHYRNQYGLGYLSIYMSLSFDDITHKQLEMYKCILSTVAADTLC